MAAPTLIDVWAATAATLAGMFVLFSNTWAW